MRKTLTEQELMRLINDHGVDDPSKPKVNLTSFANDLARLFGAIPNCSAVLAIVASTYQFRPERFDEKDKAELEEIVGGYPLWKKKHKALLKAIKAGHSLN
jgi:hypothetical protein